MKISLNAAFSVLMLFTLFGCSGSDPAPLTRGTATVYLFGSMSSVSRVVSVKSEMTVPAGVMINYSSPPGATTGKFPLRSGQIVPSGPVLFAESDIQSAECTVVNNIPSKISFLLFNTPDLNASGSIKNIRSSTIGNGVEIATIHFKLAAADVIPTVPAPWQDLSAEIGVNIDPSSSNNTLYPTGLKLNYSANFFP